MKAVLYDHYGPPEVLRLGERPVPRPRAHQALVRVHVASLNPKDVILRSGRFRLVSTGPFPRSCGYDFSGVVEAVGPEVTHVGPGSEVFGMVNGMLGRTCAEYVAVDADELTLKPSSLSFEEAASVPLVGLTALQAMRDEGQLAEGETLVVNGASGGVGTMAVQIGKVLGARVIAISSSKNAALVTELGADEVRPYDVANPLVNLPLVDVFFDVFGNQSIHEVLGLLSERGCFVATVPKLRILLDVVGTRFARRRAHLVIVRSNRADLEQLARWLEGGQLRPVVEAVYDLGDILLAHRHVQTRRTRGKVVLRVVA